MSLSEKLLADIQLFVIELGISPSALGQKSVGDASLISEIKNGRSPTLRTADRIYDYMAHERAARLEAGARRSTAYLSEQEAQDCEDALEDGPGFWARLKGALAGWLA